MRKDIQLEVVQPITASIYCEPNRKPGDVVWVTTEEAARALIEAGLCKLPGKPEKWDGRLCRRSESWPLDRFSVVEPIWKGETVVCIGGGPSVNTEKVERCRGRFRVIAINNSYHLAPWAEVCYFADARWWAWHKDRTEFREFAGLKVTINESGAMVADPAVHMLRHAPSSAGAEQPLSLKPTELQSGSNSGYQALNLAVLSGAKRVLLLGYEMGFTNGRSHWHKGHPEATPERIYHRFAERFARTVPQLKKLGVQVINCTPRSRLTAYPMKDLAEVVP